MPIIAAMLRKNKIRERIALRMDDFCHRYVSRNGDHGDAPLPAVPFRFCFLRTYPGQAVKNKTNQRNNNGYLQSNKQIQGFDKQHCRYGADVTNPGKDDLHMGSPFLNTQDFPVPIRFVSEVHDAT
jgi:hypothetical protein